MHRFYSPQSDLTARQVTITDLSEIHHMRNVLRLKKGDTIGLFDGSGKEAVGTISRSSENEIKVDIDSVRESKTKPVRLILACAIPKKAKFELIIEKCTELGVDEIIPMCTNRTEFHGKAELLQKKLTRYKTVAINAAKQSKRSRIPTIHPIMKFDEALSHLGANTVGFIPCLIPQTQKLTDVFKIDEGTRDVVFFIGPEGDFTPEEVAKAIKAGCVPVSLGATVLKVDTAAICSMALANLMTS